MMAQPSLLLFLCLTILTRIVFATTDSVVIDVTHLPEHCETKAADGKFVAVHYVGKLTDGTEFDNSFARGEPIEFQLGSGRVIPGWEEGIQGMCVGEKRRLEIPPHLGYGNEGIGPIPGGATLVFDVELVRITDEPQDSAQDDGYPTYDTYQNFGGEQGFDEGDEQLGEIDLSGMQTYGDEDDGPAQWT
ncbi:hypothetical protein Vafri_21293 [Volvox africanus]|uniref:peptidylprolyl isomerase n=1 Tax=Volvox africanus TaxID=51714 RepID=A0A8J4FEL5_9CHLO|nr:hypothetical protein Vafri_21293 [Volvox africanus]